MAPTGRRILEDFWSLRGSTRIFRQQQATDSWRGRARKQPASAAAAYPPVLRPAKHAHGATARGSGSRRAAASKPRGTHGCARASSVAAAVGGRRAGTNQQVEQKAGHRKSKRKTVGPCLQGHEDALQAVRDLHRRHLQHLAARLLEVGELGDLHAVQPDLHKCGHGARAGSSRFEVT